MAWRRELNHLEHRSHSISEADRRWGVDGKRTCRPDHCFNVLGRGRPVLDQSEMILGESQRHRDLKTLVNQPFHYWATLWRLSAGS